MLLDLGSHASPHTTYFRVATAFALTLTLGRADAYGWGCDGHRAVVFIAEQLISGATRAAVTAALGAAPIDPGLRRFCESVADDPIADSSTWADDYRDVDATTFGWHFIDVPRSVTTLTASNEHAYCPRGDCAVEAIAAQFRALSTSAAAAVKGKALRFLLHLVADLHQPLHATTNGDRGGNCVPVTYYDRMPQENPNGDFSPNLHSVWDSSTIRTLMGARGLADARALAGYIAARHPLPATVAPRAPTRVVVTGWAQQSHGLARTVVYPRLPVQVALEPASAARLSSCTGNRDVVHRMLAKHEAIDARYEQASIPVILDQLRVAGVRLAAVLKAAYP
jgi:nuclease S1